MIIGMHTGGDLIPLSAVVSLRHRKGGFHVKTVDGDTYDVSDEDWKISVETSPASTLPALPGTFLIERCDEGDGTHSIIRHTVIGWSITYEGAPLPIVLDHQAVIDSNWQVQQPDGRVERSDGQQWESAEKWLEEVSAR